MQVEYLEEFLVLAECLNYSKAAERLFIAQPVLSRHVMSLEKEFGSKLFFRDKRTVTLTEEGKLLQKEAAAFVEHWKELQLKMARYAPPGTYSLNLGLLYYSKGLFIPALNEFQRQHPDSKVSIKSKTPIEILNALMADDIDVASLIHVGFSGHETLNFLDFPPEPMVLAVDDGHRFANAGRVSVEDLQLVRLLNIDDRFYDAYYKHVRADISRLGGTIDPDPILVPDYESLLLSVERGEGAAILLETAKQHVGSHCRCIDFCEPVQVHRCLAWKRANRNPAIPRFLEQFEKPLNNALCR